MGNVSESLADVLAKLAEWLHLKPSEERRLKNERETYILEERNCWDELERVKEEIPRLENAALKLREEIERAHGLGRRIAIRQLQSTHKKLKHIEPLTTILIEGAESYELAARKIDEIIRAMRMQVDEDKLDDLNLELEDLRDRQKDRDRAREELERTVYEGTVPARDKDQPPAEEADQEIPEDLEKWLDEIQASKTPKPEAKAPEPPEPEPEPE